MKANMARGSKRVQGSEMGARETVQSQNGLEEEEASTVSDWAECLFACLFCSNSKRVQQYLPFMEQFVTKQHPCAPQNG